MTFTRKTLISAGYDCRVTCEHMPKAAGPHGHGIHCEEWNFTVIAPDAALSLAVMTPHFPPTVDVARLAAKSLASFSGANLALCSRWPTTRELIRAATKPVPCAYLGECYQAASWSLLADELVEEHFNRTAATIDDPQARLWAALEAKLALLIEQLNVARCETGDLGWQQCLHCEGAGVTPKRSP